MLPNGLAAGGPLLLTISSVMNAGKAVLQDIGPRQTEA